MRDPDEPPLQAASVEFLADMIDEIDASRDEEREALLWALMSAAWPSRATEDQ
jgi:hypothetical protein